MNKKIVLFGAVALLGVSSLIAFRGAKTLAEQNQEIAASVAAKLDAFRSEKTAECDARVNTEAQGRFDAAMAAPAAAAPGIAAPIKKGTTKKGTKTTTTKTSTGTTVDPLPQPAPPPATKDPVKTRGGAVQEGATEEVKKRGGAVQTGPDGAVKPADVKKRGGAVKTDGGN